MRGALSLPEATCVGQYQLCDDVPGHQNRDQRRERYQAQARGYIDEST